MIPLLRRMLLWAMVTVMRRWVFREKWLQTAIAVMLAFCLVVQTLAVGTVSAATDAIPADILIAIDGSICSQQQTDQSNDTHHPADLPSHRDKACLQHCSGVFGASAPESFHNLSLPSYFVLVSFRPGATRDSLPPKVVYSGHGARAPPGFII